MPASGPYRNPASPYPRRPAGGRRPDDEARQRAGRIAGGLLLGLALLSLVEHLLLTRFARIESDANQAFVTAGVSALLGLALLQGSDGARKTALWLTGIGIVALLALIPFGYLAVPEAGSSIAIVAAGGLVSAIGLAGLLVGTPSPGRIVLCGLAVVAGSVGSVAGEIWLVKRVERELRTLLAEWSTPERKIHDEPAGLDIDLPDGWVQLKPGNPMVPGEGVRAALGETTLGAVAAVIMDAAGAGYMSADDYLDRWFASRKDKLEGMRQKTREDVLLGRTTGRKMSFTWSYKGRAMQGFATAWKDGHRYFCFWGWTTSSLAPAAAPRFVALEKSLSFSAPIDTFLQETTPKVQAACPLFEPAALAVIVPSLPKGSAPAAYCRRGLDWAVRGQTHLPPGEAADFRTVTQKLFAAMSERERARLGQYMERLRQGQPTAAADDRDVAALMSAALRRLSEDDQARLTRLTTLAVDVGRLF
jgi:hypothetical protein